MALLSPSRGVTLLTSGGKQITQFIRQNPIVSGATLGGSVLTGVTALQLVRRKKKKKTTKRSRRSTRKKPGVRKSRRKRKIIRGRGLGSHEIKHTRKKTKLVSFRTKGGKTVRFKVRGKGFKPRRSFKGKRRSKK